MDQDHVTPQQAPQEWVDALDRARAGIVDGVTIPLAEVLDDLRASLARMEAGKASAKA